MFRNFALFCFSLIVIHCNSFAVTKQSITFSCDKTNDSCATLPDRSLLGHNIGPIIHAPGKITPSNPNEYNLYNKVFINNPNILNGTEYVVPTGFANIEFYVKNNGSTFEIIFNIDSETAITYTNYNTWITAP